MRVPLVDLKAQHAAIRDEVMQAAAEVIDAQAFILGAPVERFERALAGACGVEHAVGVASGSDALVLALRAAGVGAGDAVVTSAFTFVATAEAICRVGATPIFADIDPRSLTIDPAAIEDALTVAAKNGSIRVRAIVPVHLFGQCASTDAIESIARDRGLVVIEDAAQAIGARDGARAAGGMGSAGTFSFFPSKNLGAWGDGGAVTTNDASIAARVRMLRVHGLDKGDRAHGETYAEVGMNSRLDALQAAVLTVKLAHLPAWTAARRAAASRYRELLAPLAEALALPVESVNGTHAYNQFVVRTNRRDALAAHLAEHGVASRAYYPRPLHQQPCFAHLAPHAPLAETERAAATSLAIPIYAEITADQQAYVAGVITSFFR